MQTAAGQALEALYADRLEDAYDRLALHYARTGHAAKAVEYLMLVAEKAARGYAHVEAVSCLQEASEHAERLSGEEREYRSLDVAIRQASSLFWLGQRQALVERLLGHQDRVEHLQAPLLTGQYYLELGRAFSFLGKHEQAMQCLQRALAEGTHSQQSDTMGRAHALLTTECFFAGFLRQGIHHGEEAVALLERPAELYWLGMSLFSLSLVYGSAGEFPRALQAATRVHTIGETIGDRRLQTIALTRIGVCYVD